MKKIIFGLLMCLCSPLQSWGADTLDETLTTYIPSYVAVEATGTNTSGTIDCSTGANSGVGGEFRLWTTSDETDYDFVLQSVVQTSDAGQVNAYGYLSEVEFIIFGNSEADKYPTSASIADIKNSPYQNPNAIAYPVTTSVNNFESIELYDDAEYDGYHYKLATGGKMVGFIYQNVQTNPISNTYDYGSDESGVYQATLMFSALRKP
ncbi:MAG: hypothetical protein R3Y28_00665 [Candidatus Gastranaerophilales bacterium]